MPRKYFSFLSLLALCALSGTVWSATAEKAKDERVVKDGMLVSLDYTLKSPDGKLVETNKGKEPLKYVHGQKMMIPGLEKELTGMKVGDEKHITVKPEDGYGKINPQAVQEVPKEKIPSNALKVGAVLAAKSPEGGVIPMTVHEIKEKTVVMDYEPSDGRKNSGLRRQSCRHTTSAAARGAGETQRARAAGQTRRPRTEKIIRSQSQEDDGPRGICDAPATLPRHRLFHRRRHQHRIRRARLPQPGRRLDEISTRAVSGFSRQRTGAGATLAAQKSDLRAFQNGQTESRSSSDLRF